MRYASGIDCRSAPLSILCKSCAEGDVSCHFVKAKGNRGRIVKSSAFKEEGTRFVTLTEICQSSNKFQIKMKVTVSVEATASVEAHLAGVTLITHRTLRNTSDPSVSRSAAGSTARPGLPCNNRAAPTHHDGR
ncbi:hypothetical protein EVAR_16168_1 [Eumeta japonica]|uniref:Uncharacterized protein n=1 Tax=Eumeta variegata TaxID=151549 RepID=A0A4C1WDF0_EUMVA|nr:hypothetical protein EVAR_16168_1 [Eumeta japonica]